MLNRLNNLRARLDGSHTVTVTYSDGGTGWCKVRDADGLRTLSGELATITDVTSVHVDIKPSRLHNTAAQLSNCGAVAAAARQLGWTHS